TSIQNTYIQLINRAIQQMAQENNLTYLNLHDLLKDTEGNLQAKYTSDGIHLNAKAYLVWKTALEELLLR
ncbi:MAG: GDSL-type esterase/lipase family protein, partial [Bacteroidota bacterium]